MVKNNDRRRVDVEVDRVENVTSTDFPGHYPGEDHSWSIKKFKQSFKVDIHRLQDLEMEVDLIGCDASVANALRRILIAEVPTMAIETVYVTMNNSVIQDEVLAHRLGQIPIRAHPDRFRWFKKPSEGEQAEPTDYDTVCLKLDVKCEFNKEADKDEKDPLKKYINAHVYSKALEWEPQGKQAEWFAGDLIRPVNDDIIIAKLRPGQEISCVMHCNLGVGQDHAKFSPVATASYRLLPTIDILSPITGADAEFFQTCFAHGVIDLKKTKDTKTAVVANPRKDTVSRECLRHDQFKDKVKLGRIRDHFMCMLQEIYI